MRLTQYRPDDMPHCSTDPQPPSHTQFWPIPADTNDAIDDVERRPKQHIRDLGKDLKKYLHEKHRLGHSNTSSVYYQAWARKVGHCSQGPQQYANAKQPGGPPGQSHHPPLQIGGLNTAKLRHRMKVAPIANCLMCGQLDGGHHCMSGCPHMSGMYTERHNVGGRILLKALLKGGR
jgi:hypothetical protein